MLSASLFMRAAVGERGAAVRGHAAGARRRAAAGGVGTDDGVQPAVRPLLRVGLARRIQVGVRFTTEYRSHAFGGRLQNKLCRYNAGSAIPLPHLREYGGRRITLMRR